MKYKHAIRMFSTDQFEQKIDATTASSPRVIPGVPAMPQGYAPKCIEFAPVYARKSMAMAA